MIIDSEGSCKKAMTTEVRVQMHSCAHVQYEYDKSQNEGITVISLSLSDSMTL